VEEEIEVEVPLSGLLSPGALLMLIPMKMVQHLQWKQTKGSDKKAGSGEKAGSEPSLLSSHLAVTRY
jgi:hypothetical protein